ncbi:MAG: hypothetical protein ACLTXT_06215 [Ruminococcus callidus]
MQTALTKEQVSAVINAFCEVWNQGLLRFPYSYASFLNTYVYPVGSEDYDIWSHFNVSRPSYSKTSYGMSAVFNPATSTHQRQRDLDTAINAIRSMKSII